MKKILIIGDWNYDIYEYALERGFKKEKWEVTRFEYGKEFSGKNLLSKIYLKLEDKFRFGIVNYRINFKLKYKIEKERPDLIFLYRTAHIDTNILKKLKEKIGFKIFIYNNDDPFSKKYKSYVWKKYFKLLSISDIIFSYREKNIMDYNKKGYYNCKILLPYYLDDKNYCIDVKKEIDILFIGHFENDGRDKYIEILIENKIKFKLYGTGWDQSEIYDKIYQNHGIIYPIYGDEYNLEINKSKIALIFLSKINNDKYTRRNFEIPAAKIFALSEYTEELANIIFLEGKNIECFKNKKEFLHKIKYYLKNKIEREKIAENGFKEVSLKHSNLSRAKEIIKIYNDIN